ncbi:inorganic phosphate transporter [Pontibacter sp. G13]|uniref:inorganic phosphate transporter n=1 Tax=Pontibacter sp. G13 TaxID=3074898 RepID=UPI00288BCDE6|nr:inorganic phosphate transporter [Pontibacter sp. G13]WNJ17804.1 inorganic phosphate transporter [Pontibacter sp. G13]
MDTLFLVVIILMLGLAVFDLVVGVSNDAVNFLTSAVGAKAGSFKIIMLVASLGVFVGAASSGGMMEIAKRGVFNPAFFSFEHVVFIYVVVMLTDILLLDFFNSIKLPTSTTISIVFELLGASLATSYLIVYDRNEPLSEWFEYINTTKAFEMITAIFISVAVAFVVGWIVQFLLRALVTFDYKKYMRWGGAIFGAISIAVVVNFIIRVGLKHSPLKHSVMVEFIQTHATTVYLLAAVLAFAFFFLAAKRPGFDTFQIITMIGTFALAMAFASNDLVNFIGVPVAGYEAYGFWMESGQAANQYSMEVYSGPAGETTANPLFLIIAGGIMVFTLWTSKKARNVIKTTVDLSRQQDGTERFRGNDFVRGLIKIVQFAASGISSLFPRSIREAIDRRYSLKPEINSLNDPNPPAFDMVRASVNLVVAATLISMGTSLKLPLSTTYVSFMVVMGTSLADRAWNRDSIVYRVSGVFAVIAGWFMTAICALTISMIFATIVYQLGFWGIGLVLALVGVGLVIINKVTHSSAKPALSLEFPDEAFTRPPEEVKPYFQAKLKDICESFDQHLGNLKTAILHADQQAIRSIDKRIVLLEETNVAYRANIPNQLKLVSEVNVDTGKAFLDFYFLENDLLTQVRNAIEVAKMHFLNMHSPLDQQQVAFLDAYVEELQAYTRKVKAGDDASYESVKEALRGIQTSMDRGIERQVLGLGDERYTYKNSQMFLETLLRYFDASSILHRMYRIAHGNHYLPGLDPDPAAPTPGQPKQK